MSLYSLRGEQCAEVWIHPDRIEWLGADDAPFPVSYALLEEGVMERLYELGPFEQVGDDPESEVRYFRRKAVVSCEG